YRKNCAAHRKVSALARRAWRAEKGKGERGKGKGIDRRHEAIMQFGAKLSRQLLIDRVRIFRRQQFPEVALANPQRDVMSLIGELRHVEAIAAERDQRRIAFPDFEAFEISVLENQERAALVLHDCAVIGHDADALLGI